MANSYTAIPNIVPGNLTVNGNLKVSGGQIALGKFQRQYRIQEMANGQFVETVNLDRIAATQDDPTNGSLTRLIYAVTNPLAIATEAAGAPTTDTWLLQQSPGEFWLWSNSVRVGSAPPYARLQKYGNAAVLSANLQADLATRDVTANSGYALQVDSAGQAAAFRIVNVAGTAYMTSASLCIWADQNQHTISGVTGNQVITSHLLRANALGPQSAVMLIIAGNYTTGVGSGINVFLNWGATNFNILTFPASTSNTFRIALLINNLNSASVQNVSSVTTYSNVVNTPAVIPGSVNTALDTTFTLYSTTTNAPDTITVFSIDGYILNTWGAV